MPSRSWHEHGNESDQEAIPFSIHDNPVMKALALFKEEAYDGNSGHQPVNEVFSGAK